MKKKYLTPEIEVIRLTLSVDVLGLSTFSPEETLAEEIIDEDL